MSITVLVLGALHAVPPIAAGAITRKPAAAIFFGIIALIVGVIVGSDRYIAYDLLFASAGTFIGYKIAKS